MARAPARRPAPLAVTATHLRLPAPAGHDVAILLDGTVRAIERTGPGGLEWALPVDAFGRLLDVVDTASGASLLGGPVPFEPFRRVRTLLWVRAGRLVTGRFAVDGPAAPRPGPLPVELVAGGERFGRGFAQPGADGYTVRIPLERLPADEAGLELGPSIGGHVLADRLHVPADAFAHRGFLDPSEPWRVRGWALRRGAPDEAVEVALFLDGSLVATVAATLARDDVAAAGLGAGRCGFEIALPPGHRLDRAVLIDVRIAPDGPSLAGSPRLRTPAPAHLGFFDEVASGWASGWALLVAEPERPVEIELLCEGAVIGTGRADLYRGDVATSGLPSARCGFHIPLAAPARRLLGREIVARIAGTAHVLRGSPRRVALNPNLLCWLTERRLAPDVAARLRRRLSRAAGDTVVSIVMPVLDPPADWLEQAIASVRGQWSENWELICVDDGAREPAHLVRLAAGDPRIRVLRTGGRRGIAAAVNAGLAAATGAWVAFLDHDDALEPDAVHHLTQTARSTAADVIYSDEALTGPDLDDIVEVRARPGWSHDFYLSHPYFVHLVCVRTSLARALGGLDEAMPISADVDFVLRAVERARRIAHVPRVLYRWRTHAGSAGHAMQPAVMAATQGAIARHLARIGSPATVRPGPGFNQFRLDWPDPGGEILVVVPTRNRGDLLRRCLDSLARTNPGVDFRVVVVDHQSDEAATRAYLAALGGRVMAYRGPFNFARMNNAAIRAHRGAARFVLLLNNDVEALDEGWLSRLRSLAARPEVGAVGALLLYDAHRVQHGGAIVGFGGAADHAFRLVDPLAPDGSRNPGYNCSLSSLRDYSAVTAACMMLRLEAFDRVGGFDEAYAVGFNDTDLCLRLRAAGLRVLFDGHTTLLHHESATRIPREALDHPEDDGRLLADWAGVFAAGDPFYNPLLSVTGTDHVLRGDRLPADRQRPRVTNLGRGGSE